jgi:hypothetical protein
MADRAAAHVIEVKSIVNKAVTIVLGPDYAAAVLHGHADRA